MGLADKLPKTFTASNREKTRSLKRRIQGDVETPQTGPYYLTTMTVFNFLLPPIASMPPAFGKLLSDGIVDSYMQKELIECKALNWCRNIRSLLPMKNKGDGNCLLHAVSLFMWGVHDSMLLLRRLLYIALVQDSGETQARWRKERGFLDQNIPEGCQLNSAQWESEWQNVVKSAEDQKQQHGNTNRLPYESLEEVHIFMLSNILRRPIVVLGDTVIRSIKGQTLATNNFVGIYLPLLRKPSDCVKSPIVLGFASNHFVPLVAMEDDLAQDKDSMTTVEAVSLVTHTLTFIGVHFLMEEEEERVSSLLQDYLHITEVPVTQKSGLTLVLSAKLQITKLPDVYNLMIDYVQAAERVFAGKEAVLPTNQQANTDDTDLSENSKNKEHSERQDSPATQSYLASRERQQRMLDHAIQPPYKMTAGMKDHVNFNVGDKSKPHHIHNKVPLTVPPTKREQGEKVTQFTKVPPKVQRKYVEPMKCKTPKCVFYGSEETLGYCSTCRKEHLNREMAARRAAAAARMDDGYEMSVTSTDCQFPNCPFVASVYTYPYCHEHETLSPCYTSPGRDSAAASAGNKQQVVNDLNKERKSSSLTEKSSGTGNGSSERQHSRSLENTDSTTEGPGYVHEAKPHWCKIPGCNLRGHPENDFVCTQHCTEIQLRRQQKQRDRLRSNKDQDKKEMIKTLEKNQRVEEWLRSSHDLSGHQMHQCKNENCTGPGNVLFKGLCTNCYIKCDMGGDTEVIEKPRYREEKKEVDDPPTKEDDKRNKDEKLRQSIDKLSRDPESIQGPTSVAEEETKEDEGRADTREFHKCKKDTCNRLAPPDATDGLCADCHEKAQRTLEIVEPPITHSLFEPGLRVDTAASPISNPTSHSVRNVSLQSFPSMSVKQTHPVRTTEVPPTEEEIFTQLKCATPGCSGIYANLDKNNTGLCYKCLKARKPEAMSRKEAGTRFAVESTNPDEQSNDSGPGESPVSNGDSMQSLQRLSGGRRSGRKRHTIAIPPSTYSYGMQGVESRKEGKSCMSPLCDNTGSPSYGGFCKACYEWMCLKFDQFDMHGTEIDEMRPCATKGCEFYGTQATKGYCSQCYRKQQAATGKEVTFGMERRYSSGRSITPPPGALGQLCANQCCDQYGQKAFYNFCPSCFKVFDSCTGIRYNPPPTRGSFAPPDSNPLDSEPYCWSPATAAVPPSLPPRGATSVAAPFIPPNDIGSPETSIPYYTTHTSGKSTARPTDVAAQFGQTMERVETATRVGKAKCLTPNCSSFGNSKCQGYCNGCFVKLHRASFV